MLTRMVTRMTRIACSSASPRLQRVALVQQSRNYREYNSMDELLSASEAWHLLVPERRLNNEAALRRTFEKLDLDGNGLIDPSELRIALITLDGMPAPGFSQALLDAQVDEMIAWADVDKDGMISFEEYQKIIQAGCDPESGRRLATKPPVASTEAATPAGIPVVTSEGSTIYL